jgi:hypothetical protein
VACKVYEAYEAYETTYEACEAYEATNVVNCEAYDKAYEVTKVK